LLLCLVPEYYILNLLKLSMKLIVVLSQRNFFGAIKLHRLTATLNDKR
jgi:hypothetical protein